MTPNPNLSDSAQPDPMAMAQTQGENQRLSFKGTLDGFRQWSIAMSQMRGKKKTRMTLWKDFLAVVAADEVPLRSGRREPRAVKKRPQYPFLKRPRNIYVEPMSRTKRRILFNARKRTVILK